ncbi:MAG: hypothetical protein AABX75_03335 [Nanoarchaeota archaeon]
MNDIANIFDCLSRLEFKTKGSSYVREIKPGVGIAVGIDKTGWTVMPLLHVIKILPRGKTINDVTKKIDDLLDEDGELNPIKNSQHGEGHSAKEFLRAVEIVRDYLKKVITAYEIKF